MSGATGGPLPVDRISWAAWRVAEDGRVEVAATLSPEDEEGEPERVRRDYPTLDAAAGELGESFREVVERVLGEGLRQGRWRP